MAENVPKPDHLKLKLFPFFSSYKEGELKKIYDYVDEWEFTEGSVLAFPQDTWDQAFFILSGSLSLEREGDKAGVRTYFGPGEVWGLDHLEGLCLGDGVVKGHTPGKLLVLSKSPWEQFQIRTRGKGKSSLHLPSLAKKWKFLFPGEEFIRLSRSSRWFLALNLIPWFLTLILTVLLGFGFYNSFGGVQGRVFLGFLGILTGLVSIFGGGITYWLWGRQLLILTGTSLVRREFSGKLKHSGVQKIPLSEIQSLTVEKKGFLFSLLQIGTLRVKTSALGGEIVFPGLSRPETWEHSVGQLKQNLNHQSQKATRENLRTLLREKIGQPAGVKVLKTAKIPQNKTQRRNDWERSGDNMIFRKHPRLLLKKIWWGLLGLGTMILLGVLGAVNHWDGFWLLLWVSLGIVGFSGKVFWEYWDWDNDIFQISPQGVTDFDRKPLWFGESKKEAPWGAIQGVGVEKTGWIPLILDFGNVNILTGGADSGLVFEGVKHPELVQAQIFSGRQAYWQKKEAQEKNQRGEEMAEILEIYDQGKENGDL